MKTIFINIFSILTVDNFTIPGGVMDQLIERKDDNTRIVILTTKLFEERLAPYTKNKNVSIEFIAKIPPKGIIQKLFQFFYSFLIFTGSTRILATFGARADIPPAGGNRFYAPLKSLVANTFGRFAFIKRNVTPWLYFKIFRARPYRKLFDTYNPTLVFVPSIAFFPDVELVAEAKRRGIRTVGMVSNWDHLNKYYIPLHADHILVQNEPMKREATGWHAYDEAQVQVVGFPQFDLYSDLPKYLVPKAEFFKEFKIAEGTRLILFISGAAYSLDEPDILKTISKWIGEGKFGPNMKLFLRPYAIARDLEREKEKYQEFEHDPNIIINWRRGDESLINRRYYMSMLYYADVVISIFSTTAIETAIFDRPTITIGFDGYQKRPYHQSIVRLEDMSHFRNVLDTNSVKVVRSFDDLSKTLQNYLEKPEIDSAERKVLVEKMCYKNDGEASKRIADFILEKNNG